MKPRLPLDAVLSTPSVVAKRNADDYVSDLVEYMKSVHQFVQNEHKRIRERERDMDIRKRDMDRFKIGDYVFLKRPGLKSEPGHSRRFNSETDARLFQIIHTPSISYWRDEVRDTDGPGHWKDSVRICTTSQYRLTDTSRCASDQQTHQ